MRTRPFHAVVSTLALVGLLAVGCTRDDELKRDHKELGDKMSATQPMAADACSHCPGTQVLAADGTCPACKMKM